MKKLLLLCIFLGSSLYSVGQRSMGFPYPPVGDSGQNPSLCDTLKYVFRQMTDSLGTRTFVAKQDSAGKNDSIVPPSVGHTRPFGRMSDNVYSGSPFEYFCPYKWGKDSITMFNIFTGLVPQIKACLLVTGVKSADGYLSYNPQNSRDLRYEFVIKDLQEGMDPKLNNVIIRIEFLPDTNGSLTDAFTIYRVNLMVRP